MRQVKVAHVYEKDRRVKVLKIVDDQDETPRPRTRYNYQNTFIGPGRHMNTYLKIHVVK